MGVRAPDDRTARDLGLLAVERRRIHTGGLRDPGAGATKRVSSSAPRRLRARAARTAPAPFPIADPDRYDAVVDVLFKHRRKTVENGLRLGWKAIAESPEALEAVLPTVPFRTRRVEALSPEEIGRIADAVRMAKG